MLSTRFNLKQTLKARFKKKTGFNIAFGVFNDDLNNLPNFEQYFKLRVRNYAFVSS